MSHRHNVRLMKEIQKLSRADPPVLDSLINEQSYPDVYVGPDARSHLEVAPLSTYLISPEEGKLRWHFLLFNLCSSTEYSGGIYHGVINFPVSYPHAAPDLRFLTPNGRFQVNTNICTTATSFHPEAWSPLITAEKLVIGIQSHMYEESGDAIGAIKSTAGVKRSLALQSVEVVRNSPSARQNFPNFLLLLHARSAEPEPFDF